ncbi:MAG: nickel pincer cofactor biosynthesis protein LarB [Dehalococcoidia bacterium]|nr:nickel pincer cofactor biosynthesis protein LarB [Dehalococcoidia bacterium]
MDRDRLRALLQRVQHGATSPDDALRELARLPFEDLGFARVDHHRALRKGFPEVVFGLGKTPQQTAAITQRLAEQHDRVLVTRASPEAFAAVKQLVPDATYRADAKAIVVDRRTADPPAGQVAVLCAGTADLPVAEEAALTAQLMDCQVQRLYDVGVAGLHRLLGHIPALQQARAIVVVAGMEGALPSVVAGLVAAPVIAVPTSVGYGASFQGLAALLAMLTSCSPGVAVVNIDNGFGAGYLAGVIAQGAGQEGSARP